MNLRVLSVASVVMIACAMLAGCDRNAKAKKDADDAKDIHVEVKQKDSSPFKSAEEVFKYPNNPRGNDDWTRFRDGLQLLADHFNKPEVVGRLRLSDKERDFLQKEVHLNKSELIEVESTVFRTADAFHMDECYLLRDVAEHLEVKGLPPLEQASLDFAWVMRNVMLHESSDTWFPPAFTVRRGWGSALERSLVFLALLRQSQADGCLIVVPDSEPLQFLVAVYDAPSKSLRLFDPRLERPVLSKDGKGIATVQDVMETPALLNPSLITAEQTKKLEAWMVCPLYALAPRMLELQKGLRAHDFVTLYLSPENLRNQLAKVTTLPIKVWNSFDDTQPTAKGGGKPAKSPTRSLRLFLPKSDGGLDDTNRLTEFNIRRLPLKLVFNNYAQTNLTRALLPVPVFELLTAISIDLLSKYDIQTRELFLRGRYEPMIRRQERIQDFANNDALANLLQDAAFQKERAEWQEKVRDAFANLPADPTQRNKAILAIQSQITQDQYIGFLLQVDKEEKLERGFKKTVLTKILAVGLRDYLQSDLARSRASSFHEIAADRQATLDAAVKPSKSFQTRVHDSWFDAKSAWGNSYVDRIALEQTVQQRIEQIQKGIHPEDYDSRVGMLETLHLDVQKYFQARLRLAETLAHTDGKKVSFASLTKTKLEIESMEKAGLLKNEIKNIRATLREPSREFFQKRLDLLEHDWSERGNYFWLKRQIDLRLDVPVK